jgi:hypothetical protein
VVLALSCLAVCAQVAVSLEPGVHADPGSPAAKQYALPLNQARQTGGGDTGNAAASESTAPFGAGIKPSGPGGSGRGRSSGGNTSDTARRGASGTGSYASRTPVPASVLRAARSQTSSSDGGSILTLLGGGVAVLLIGAFGGTLVRRGRRSIPSA